MIVVLFFALILFIVMIETIYENFNIPVTAKYILITLLMVVVVIGLIIALFWLACYAASFNVSRETCLELVRFYPQYL